MRTAFFALDPSSRGENSYDVLSAAAAEPDRIRPEDVTALNTSMRARTSPERWQDLFAQDDLPWLRGLDPSWDLVEMADTEWHKVQVEQRIREALDGIVAPYRNISVATKMLHFKRPRLIPVLDSLVLEMLGVRIPAENARDRRLDRASAVIVHLRQGGRRQAEVLRELQANLRQLEIERPLVRILDALLWAGHPDSLVHPAIGLVQRWRAEDQG